MTHAEYAVMDRVWPSEKIELCHVCDLIARIRTLESAVAYLDGELETATDKLSACWMFLDGVARLRVPGEAIKSATPIQAACEHLLRQQQSPGWKE